MLVEVGLVIMILRKPPSGDLLSLKAQAFLQHAKRGVEGGKTGFDLALADDEGWADLDRIRNKTAQKHTTRCAFPADDGIGVL